MILNNCGQMTISQQGDGGEIKYESGSLTTLVDYSVVSTDQQKVEGTIAAQKYCQITPNGKPPYTVKMGFGDFSHSVTQEGVESSDVVSFVMTWPCGTSYKNYGPHIFLNKASS
ncbi:hypothetical protein SPSIL_049830 [Sporomusa silvacetica DSM 10669]|uniref:Uncharacterized protein n=1 Tax=Sporomusa silvacetica DSM 10669 TaxID=1123289 RepID=A0ABZ3IT51_9FIRM|nr:hypothetical protein [Sporomusa silvacetica]OZC15462.1 hypothetical protein SPSIL_41630 [Sporomusa silvacetica DSM 10669]